MRTIYLVRHAAAHLGKEADPGLSDAGRAEADALGHRLAAEPIDTVLHSPKARARPTADAVSAHLRDVRIRATDLLDDRTAVPSPERVNEYPAHRHDWPAQVPQAERDVDGRRMTSAWERLSTLEPDGALLLVTHAFVVAWFVREVLGAPPGHGCG